MVLSSELVYRLASGDVGGWSVNMCAKRRLKNPSASDE